MTRLFAFFGWMVLLSLTHSLSGQVTVQFTQRDSPFSLADAYNLTIHNQTGVDLTAAIEVKILDPNDLVLYGFFVAEQSLKPGVNLLSQTDYQRLQAFPNELSQERIRGGVKWVAKLLYPIEPHSIIDQSEIHLGENVFQWRSSAADSLANRINKEHVIIRNSMHCPLGILPQKMNVLYIGLENPVKIMGANETSQLYTNAGGVTIERQFPNQYVVTPSRPGQITLEVVHGEEKSSAMFRVKRIPDPVARLSSKSGGSMNSGEFKAQMGIFAMLENFDFDARCDIAGFEFWRIGADGTRTTVVNQGGRFTGEAQALVREAEPGDVYLFQNIRARCPGDFASRPIGTMSFFIK